MKPTPSKFTISAALGLALFLTLSCKEEDKQATAEYNEVVDLCNGKEFGIEQFCDDGEVKNKITDEEEMEVERATAEAEADSMAAEYEAKIIKESKSEVAAKKAEARAAAKAKQQRNP